MNLTEAFKALDALNEDTFSVSDDGISKLSTFMRDDDDVDVSVIDPEAETEEDIQDSYVGKVILDCKVCHSKVYKDKEDIELDEEQTSANVGEECPYCYTTDGYDIIGEVASFENTDESKDDESINESYRRNNKPRKGVYEAVAKYRGKPGYYISSQRDGFYLSKSNAGGGVKISEDNFKWLRNTYGLEKLPAVDTPFGKVTQYRVCDKSVNEAVATMERPAKKDLTSIDGTIASVLNAHKEEIDACGMNMNAIKSCVTKILTSGEVKGDAAAQKAVMIINNCRNLSQLLSTLTGYMTGMNAITNRRTSGSWFQVDFKDRLKDKKVTEAVEYVRWVQLPDGKWKMWGSNPGPELDPNFLDRAREQNNIDYKDAKVSKNGEYPEGVDEKDIHDKHRFNESKSIKESISETEIASVLNDARDNATDFGITDEFTNEYYIGQSVSAFGYPLEKLFIFLPDHISEEDKEYQDAVKGWKENEQIYESKSMKESIDVQKAIDWYVDSGAADEEAEEYCPENPDDWNVDNPYFEDRAIAWFETSPYYDDDAWENDDLDESKSIKEDTIKYDGNSEECTFCGNECSVDNAEDTGTSLIFNCSNCGNRFEISKTVDIEKEFSNLAHVIFSDYLYGPGNYLYGPIRSDQQVDDAVRLALTHDKYFSNRLSSLDTQQVVSKVSEMVKQLEYNRLGKLRNKPSSIVRNESKSIKEDTKVSRDKMIYTIWDAPYKSKLFGGPQGVDETFEPTLCKYLNCTVDELSFVNTDDFLDAMDKLSDSELMNCYNDYISHALSYLNMNNIHRLTDDDITFLKYIGIPVDSYNFYDAETAIDVIDNAYFNNQDDKNYRVALNRIIRGCGANGYPVDGEFYEETYWDYERALELIDVLNYINNKQVNESKSLKEDVNNVNVETDDSIVNVNTDDNGKVTVTTEPKVSDNEPNNEVIVPVTDETQATIENGVESVEDEFVDAEFDGFDEEAFDNLGESYLKDVYSNVDSYKTEKVKVLNDSKLVVEGWITFTSGSKKKTSFLFEAKDCTRNGKYRFTGENQQLTRGKKAFTISGALARGKFITESFNYNYRSRDSKGKSTRIYGTLRNRKGRY